MQLGLIIAVAVLIVGIVAWPLLFANRRAHTRPSKAGDTTNQDTALASVYEAIRTLQVEHQLGRVADDDYQAQLSEYRRRAAIILREIDQSESEPASRIQP
jgi:hypothetical protein